MKKITFFVIAAMLILAGCGKLSSKEGSEKDGGAQTTINRQATDSSKSQSPIKSDAESEGDQTGQKNTATTVQNSKDIDLVQSQLDELEEILKDLDDISESDLEIPDP